MNNRLPGNSPPKIAPRAAKRKTNSGKYTLKNPSKYLGNKSEITWRSSWELRMMHFLDLNPNVINWASEEIKIHYHHPIKNKIATYIPDFFVTYKDKTGAQLSEIIEIKPRKETLLNKKPSMYDKVAITINEAKWAAARAYCSRAGLKFRVLTEDHIFK